MRKFQAEKIALTHGRTLLIKVLQSLFSTVDKQWKWLWSRFRVTCNLV